MSITDSTILNRAALKVEDDLTYLIDCLAEVLESCGDGDLVPYLPWRGDAADVPAPAERSEEQLLSSFCFQLLNAVEENVAMQARRWREDAEVWLPSAAPGHQAGSPAQARRQRRSLARKHRILLRRAGAHRPPHRSQAQRRARAAP